MGEISIGEISMGEISMGKAKKGSFNLCKGLSDAGKS
jgi:hypothetical protein